MLKQKSSLCRIFVFLREICVRLQQPHEQRYPFLPVDAVLISRIQAMVRLAISALGKLQALVYDILSLEEGQCRKTMLGVCVWGF